jgi:mannose/fructose/N-acetylgalactosamine-specific phosphotransferase system component IIB
MPISMVRIDDRLIHGQVVLGWSRVLKPDRIAVANDRVATNSWERKFYTASVPPHIKVSFLTLEETAVELASNIYRNESVLMLFEAVRDLYIMVEKGVQLEEVNIGGLHHREGAEELLPYVFLTEEDRGLLRELVKQGVTLRAQEVPGSSSTVINSLVV